MTCTLCRRQDNNTKSVPVAVKNFEKNVQKQEDWSTPGSWSELPIQTELNESVLDVAEREKIAYALIKFWMHGRLKYCNFWFMLCSVHLVFRFYQPGARSTQMMPQKST